MIPKIIYTRVAQGFLGNKETLWEQGGRLWELQGDREHSEFSEGNVSREHGERPPPPPNWGTLVHENILMQF
jgi:hypothetical protein